MEFQYLLTPAEAIKQLHYLKDFEDYLIKLDACLDMGSIYESIPGKCFINYFNFIKELMNDTLDFLDWFSVDCKWGACPKAVLVSGTEVYPATIEEFVDFYYNDLQNVDIDE